MGNISYKPIIDDMVWSFSRIQSYNDCPYKFFLTYIKQYEQKEMFFASYGKYVHNLIEKYYIGELSKSELCTEFLAGFSDNVKGFRPQPSTLEKYIKAGSEYFRNFKPFPFNMIDVEKRVDFKIGEHQFIGYIDYLGELSDDIYIVDNKSRDLSPRSNRKNPTSNDKALDDMLCQLYIYSAAVEQEYGKLPKALCFNCFKNQNFILEDFDECKFQESKQWALDSIGAIAEDSDFEPRENYFKCSFICGVNYRCKYYNSSKER